MTQSLGCVIFFCTFVKNKSVMKTSFKVKKSGNYIDIKYIAGIEVPITSYDNFLASNKKGAIATIDLIRKLEVEIQEILVQNQEDLDFRWIILRHIHAIDSIASGIDLRSGLPISELADRFVYGYKVTRDRINKECLETLKFFNENKETTSYMMNWRIYDKFNRDIKSFYLPYESINMDDFQKDELKNISSLVDDMLETLIKTKKNEK